MTIIKITPIAINPYNDEEENYFGDETGTPIFYTMKHILQKYLGENINVSWNYDDFTYEIEDLNEDEGYDNLQNYIDNIQNIYESMEPFNYEDLKNCHLMFMINNIE
jgi:hypothetical protein